MATEVDSAAFTGEEDWGPPSNPPHPPGNVRIVIEGGPDEPLVQALTSLLIGSATEGGDQFVRRLKEWQANSNRLSTEIYSESPNETDTERVRYALIGLLSKAPNAAQGLMETALDVSEVAYRQLSSLLGPVTSSRTMRPVRQRYDKLAAHGETIAEGWIDAGRREEQRGRALARQAAFDETDEAFDFAFGRLSKDPAVRDLVMQQGFGMADELMGQVRTRGASADVRWERRIRKLLGRR